MKWSHRIKGGPLREACTTNVIDDACLNALIITVLGDAFKTYFDITMGDIYVLVFLFAT